MWYFIYLITFFLSFEIQDEFMGKVDKYAQRLTVLFDSMINGTF